MTSAYSSVTSNPETSDIEEKEEEGKSPKLNQLESKNDDIINSRNSPKKRGRQKQQLHNNNNYKEKSKRPIITASRKPPSPTPPPKRPKVTKNFELSEDRLIPYLGHIVEWRERREACQWCVWLTSKNRRVMDRKNPQQSQLWCTSCNVPLCANKSRNCFYDFHNLK